jgi:two-component system, sensor histidine kinase PdtaS
MADKLTAGKSIALVFLATLAVMTVFVASEQILVPDIPVWESHILTVLFTSCLAVILSYFIFRPVREVNQAALKEPETGITAGKEPQTRHAGPDTGLRVSSGSGEWYSGLIDQIPDFVIVHRDGIILYANPATASYIGCTTSDLIGRPVLSFIAPEDQETVKKVIEERKIAEASPYEIKIRTKNGTFHTMLINGSTIRFDGGPAVLAVITDIETIKQAEKVIRCANEDLERKVVERTDALIRANEELIIEIEAHGRAEAAILQSLEEKDVLLREIHHRVKNNLQIIISLMNLQSQNITDKNVLGSLRDCQSRVWAMALVHERIYRSHGIAEINLKDYLDYLTKQIIQIYGIRQHRIEITVTMDDLTVDIDTVIPTGLIMNELITNSFKHAFPEGQKGSICIECTPLGADRIRIVYHDTGTGIPAGFDWKQADSLGLQLMNSLVDQLEGTIELVPGEGTTFIIEIRNHRARAPGTPPLLPSSR